MKIDATNVPYKDLNAQIRAAVAKGEKAFDLKGVNGQRFIADGLRGKIKIDIHGVPGNDLGAFMDGPEVTVYGNAQDAVGNTMNAGKIIVRGNAGDVLGYGMRGGRLFVRGSVGYRVGIHMKAYQEQIPVLVAGETAGDFFGEYMAGGVLVLLGLSANGSLVGDYCGTGMHGGTIYLRGKVDPALVATEQVGINPATDQDLAFLEPVLAEFCAEFKLDLKAVMSKPFTRLAPVSHRPYGSKYAT